jgi:hypothetical protein
VNHQTSAHAKGFSAAVLALSFLALPGAAMAEKTLRIGMTAADIPRTLGQPDQGFEGNRFTGIPMYDALTQWDLSKGNGPSLLIPDLATEWKVDAADKTKWTFKLRPGVKFHDGSAFNADAVVWNVNKVLDKTAKQFDASQVGVTASRMPTLRSAKKIDDLTVELVTSEPDSFLPYNISNLAHAVGEEVRRRASLGDRCGRAQQAGVGRLRRRRLRHRPVQDDPLRPARAPGTGQERQLLGQQARAQDRQGGDGADARGQRAHRRAAVGPGRLDRGSRA